MNLTWAKVLSVTVTLLGIVSEVSKAAGEISLPGNWGIVVAGGGLVSADILQILEKLYPSAVPLTTKAV